MVYCLELRGITLLAGIPYLRAVLKVMLDYVRKLKTRFSQVLFSELEMDNIVGILIRVGIHAIGTLRTNYTGVPKRVSIRDEFSTARLKKQIRVNVCSI